MEDANQSSGDTDAPLTSHPQQVPGDGVLLTATAGNDLPEQAATASWDTICSRSKDVLIEGLTRNSSNIEGCSKAAESIALPFPGLGSFGRSLGPFSTSNGSLASFSGASDHVPVRWDSANSTEFHKSTSSNIWSIPADSAKAATLPADLPWQYQHSNCTNTSADGRGSFRILSGSNDRSSSDKYYVQDLPPLSVPPGLQGVSFLQHPAPGTPAVVPPLRARITAASPDPTPSASYSSLSGGLSSASTTSPLGLLPLSTMGSLARYLCPPT